MYSSSPKLCPKSMDLLVHLKLGCPSPLYIFSLAISISEFVRFGQHIDFSRKNGLHVDFPKIRVHTSTIPNLRFYSSIFTKIRVNTSIFPNSKVYTWIVPKIRKTGQNMISVHRWAIFCTRCFTAYIFKTFDLDPWIICRFGICSILADELGHLGVNQIIRFRIFWYQYLGFLNFSKIWLFSTFGEPYTCKLLVKYIFAQCKLCTAGRNFLKFEFVIHFNNPALLFAYLNFR